MFPNQNRLVKLYITIVMVFRIIAHRISRKVRSVYSLESNSYRIRMTQV